MPRLPAVVSGLCEKFREGLETALGDSFASLHVFGALSFPRPVGWLIDVDFHVLLHRHITEMERAAVRDLHANLATSSPLGGELDGQLHPARGRGGFGATDEPSVGG